MMATQGKKTKNAASIEVKKAARRISLTLRLGMDLYKRRVNGHCEDSCFSSNDRLAAMFLSGALRV